MAPRLKNTLAGAGAVGAFLSIKRWRLWVVKGHPRFVVAHRAHDGFQIQKQAMARASAFEVRSFNCYWFRVNSLTRNPAESQTHRVMFRMAVNSQHFLLAALILAIGAVTSRVNAAADLASGETRLPSGVVVRIDDAPSSAEEAKRSFDEKFGTTFKEAMRAVEDLISDTQAERLSTKIEIIDPLHYSIQSVCDEYMNYAFKPYYRSLPPTLKEVVVEISGLQSRRSEGKCIYKVSQGPRITHQDDLLLPDISFEKVQLDDKQTVSIALMSENREIDKPLPIKEILIIEPFTTSELVNLAPYLERLAKKLYDTPVYRGTIIRFVVAERNVEEGAYKPLGIKVWAFRTISGSVVFVEFLMFQRAPRDAVKPKVREVLTIAAWSSHLSEAAAAGLNSETLRNYLSDGLNRDAAEVFDILGRYSAERFKVSQVGVYETTMPGGKFWIRAPVVFEFDDGVWKITTKPN